MTTQTAALLGALISAPLWIAGWILAERALDKIARRSAKRVCHHGETP